jgi:hypothetical protein
MAAERNQAAILYQPLCLVPGWQVTQAVHAHEKEQLRLIAHFLAHQAHHVGGIVWPWTVGIEAADADVVNVRGRQFAHGEAVSHRRELALLLVGRITGWNQIDLVQRQLKMSFFGENQMADVDGIKGPAKDSNALAVGIIGIAGIVDRMEPFAAIRGYVEWLRLRNRLVHACPSSSGSSPSRLTLENQKAIENASFPAPHSPRPVRCRRFAPCRHLVYPRHAAHR